MANFCIRGDPYQKKHEIIFAIEVLQFIYQSKALVELIRNMLFSKMFTLISALKKPKNSVKNIPYRKIGPKKGSKKVIFWKKIFLGKTQKHKVFIFDKVKLRVGVYFSGAI